VATTPRSREASPALPRSFLVRYARQMAEKPDASTPRQTESWGDCKAAYRMLQQEPVTFEAVTAVHCERTLGQVYGRNGFDLSASRTANQVGRRFGSGSRHSSWPYAATAQDSANVGEDEAAGPDQACSCSCSRNRTRSRISRPTRCDAKLRTATSEVAAATWTQRLRVTSDDYEHEHEHE
jgi:hypothetical protein